MVPSWNKDILSACTPVETWGEHSSGWRHQAPDTGPRVWRLLPPAPVHTGQDPRAHAWLLHVVCSGTVHFILTYTCESTVKPELAVTFFKQPNCLKQPYIMFPNFNFVLVFTSTNQPPGFILKHTSLRRERSNGLYSTLALFCFKSQFHFDFVVSY